MKSTSRHLAAKPQTDLGFWSIWLEAAFVVLFVINIFVNIYLIKPDIAQPLLSMYMAFVISMLAFGLAGGILGIIAVTKRREHSPLVWISTLLGLFVLLLILNELMQGIQYMLHS